ncbi:MAG TPA: rhomboid family intramembrane serine protease, partial [Hyphomicrobium sp.]|nr:rhomboid family intramembrane serine protease [Hyphomicrobium sp.]
MRRKPEPMFNVPGVVLGVFAVMFAIHALRLWVMGEEALIWEFAFIPGRFALLFGLDPLQALTDRLATEAETSDLIQRVALARAIAIEGEAKPWTALTYAMLHGSWAHLLLNSIWLMAFGSAVARRFGSVRFVAFMALTAIGGALGHLVTHTDDVIPMIGASAAVSGCMAAALRFAFQAGAPLGGFSIGG